MLAVYPVLKFKSKGNMWTVIMGATTIARSCFALAGYSGQAPYVTYDDADVIMLRENILVAPYQSTFRVHCSTQILYPRKLESYSRQRQTETNCLPLDFFVMVLLSLVFPIEDMCNFRPPRFWCYGTEY